MEGHAISQPPGILRLETQKLEEASAREINCLVFHSTGTRVYGKNELSNQSRVKLDCFPGLSCRPPKRELPEGIYLPPSGSLKPPSAFSSLSVTFR